MANYISIAMNPNSASDFHHFQDEMGPDYSDMMNNLEQELDSILDQNGWDFMSLIRNISIK